MRAYRSYKQLIEHPNDMNAREKERYERIMKIPEELREVLAQDAEDLLEVEGGGSMKAKVEKIVTVHEPCEIEITGATLLTVDEAKSLLTINDRACESWWWLRSPGNNQLYAAYVRDDGSVYAYGLRVDSDGVGVRPALKIENLALPNLKIGDTFCFCGERFKLISARLALCETIIGLSIFDKSSNDYDRSEIKAYVDQWFDELMNRGTGA